MHYIRERRLVLYLFIGFCIGFLNGCRNPEQFKEEADIEVYNIIDSKWQDSFGEKVNYHIEDAPPSPNDIQFDNTVMPSGTISLAEAVSIATGNSRDYKDRKDSLYLSALGLSNTRYQYAFQWMGTVDGSYTWDAGEEETRVGSNLDLSKQTLLPNGIMISSKIGLDWVRFLTGDSRTTLGTSRTTLGTVLTNSITIPLLGNGGGKAAWENLTQAERDVLYQIRTFNRFRKTFVVGVINSYYAVLQSREQVINAQNDYNQRLDTTKRLQMEAETGRQTQMAVDEARQSEFSSRDNYVSAQRTYDQALDTFKVNQLSLPPDVNIVLDSNELIVLEQLGVTMPDYTVDEAIETALLRRLDLANTADGVDDQVRKLLLAEEGLGPQLELTGTSGVTSTPDSSSAGLQFYDEGSYGLGFLLDLPLDRLNERNAYRSALIGLASQQRQYDQEKDDIELGVNNSHRRLLETAERYRIQKMSLDLAKRRVESNQLLLDVGRVTIRVVRDSQDALLQSQNAFTGALIAHQIAKLNFFRDIGVLQVKPDGMWELPEWNKTETAMKYLKAVEVSQDL
ncbi:MAG: TolC family protein [Planctomycetota bacterium]|jgi:outer membrane protein TolC